jgi:hypothetical protein
VTESLVLDVAVVDRERPRLERERDLVSEFLRERKREKERERVRVE